MEDIYCKMHYINESTSPETVLTALMSWTALAGTRVRWATSRVAGTARACPSGGAATAPATAATTATRRSVTWPPGSTCAPTPGAGTSRYIYIYTYIISTNFCAAAGRTSRRAGRSSSSAGTRVRCGRAWPGGGATACPCRRARGTTAGGWRCPTSRSGQGGVIRLDKTVFLPAADRHGHLHLLRHGPTRRPGRGRGLRLPSSGAA